MLIQNEYCDGGSLAGVIEQYRKDGRAFAEEDLTRILTHVAMGLRILHAKGLAHLDIKPGNIFLKTEDRPETPLAGEGGLHVLI
jgi:serine/threonine protein kinase